MLNTDQVIDLIKQVLTEGGGLITIRDGKHSFFAAYIDARMNVNMPKIRKSIHNFLHTLEENEDA